MHETPIFRTLYEQARKNSRAVASGQAQGSSMKTEKSQRKYQTTKQTTRAFKAKWEQADTTKRRCLIVEAALTLLDEQGLAAVTMRRVASKLGVGAMTLYTYVNSQHDLHQAMVQRGFEMMGENCQEASTLETPQRWRGGALAYLRFAITNPNLYKLMFDVPMQEGDGDLLAAGFAPLVDKVKTRLTDQGLKGKKLDQQAISAAGRYWIALHGLASLAIAERLDVLNQHTEKILDDLLVYVSPD